MLGSGDGYYFNMHQLAGQFLLTVDYIKFKVCLPCEEYCIYSKYFIHYNIFKYSRINPAIAVRD